MSNSHRPQRRRRRRRLNIISIASLLIVLLAALAIAADFTVRWSQRHGQNFAYELNQAAIALETANQTPGTAILNAQQHLSAARTELETLRPVAGPVVYIADKLAGLPLIGEPADQVVALWLFADATTHLGEELLAAARLGLLSLESQGTAGLVETLPTLQAYLQQAQGHFTQARTARARLATTPAWLPDNLAARLDPALTQWDSQAPRLETLLAGADRLLGMTTLLLSSDQPQTYLLLLQSSDELRATGGFINSVGTIRFAQGEISQVTLQEVQAAEIKVDWNWQQGYLEPPPPPPPPMVDDMGLGHWVLRDANWWADFPTTARQAMALWKEPDKNGADGIIAITDRGLAALLEATGPVETTTGQVVNADNLKQVTLAEVYGEGIESAPTNQAAFFSELALAIYTLAQELPPERLLRVVEILPQAFSQGDFLVASFDLEVATTLHQLGLDGALLGSHDDYFYLVEHNISYNKLSPFIRQALRYEVELGPDGRPTLATLTVDETNTYSPQARPPGYPDTYYYGGRWNPATYQLDRWEGYYGGYTRLYLPPGSRMLGALGYDESPQTGQESSRTVTGGYVGLLPGEQRQLRYKWEPEAALSLPGHYRLVVQRQPGAPAHPLTVVVHLPPGGQAKDITPPPAATTAETVTWQTSLEQTRLFSLRLAGHPRQKITTPVALAPTATAPPLTPRSVAPAPPPPPGRAPRPAWLSIPAIGVGAPIVPLGLEEPGGLMASPTEADIVGWYELGPRPGEPSNAVLSGHVNWQGQAGVFTRLHELRIGDTVEVQSGPQAGYRYVVESIETYQADTAPVGDIFGATTEPVLTLITCGGPYNRDQGQYRDRLVVRATAVER